jgi:WD40 repeat protein/transcriptional regulator with XRE-family HTH domain
MCEVMKRVFHTQLRSERERRGWSRNYVAEQVEVDVATVGRWERGERLPYPHYRQKICALFELSAQEIGLYPELGEESIEETPLLATCEPELPRTMQDNRMDVQLLRSRRTFLVGLSGIGAITLFFGGAWMIMSRASSPPPSHFNLLAQLIDPNTSNWINNLVWSPDGNTLAAANGDPMVTTWNVAQDALINSYSTLGQWVNDVAWSHSNQMAAATADEFNTSGAIHIWMLAEKEHSLLTLQRPYSQRAVAWSPDGAYLACAGHQTHVEIWGPINKPVSYYLPTNQDIIGINRVKWSTDASYLAAAADNGHIYVWEISTGHLKTVYQGHTERVVDIVWLPKGYHIASASVDHTVQIWNAINGQHHLTYRGHSGEVHGVDCSPDGKYVVSAGYDTTAQVWDPLTGKHITTYSARSSKLLCAIWSPDGQAIALGSQQQGIEVWQAPS